MSVDVIFPSYPGYYPYSTACYTDSKKFTLPKMLEPVSDTRHSSPSSQGSPVIQSTSSYNRIITKIDPNQDDTDKDNLPKDTQYVNPNCVLFTYFSGDISANVDEHFTRALSLPSSYSATDNQPTPRASPTWKDSSPMSRRNFPPSFWNSNAHPPSSGALSTHGLPLHADPYMSSALHSLHDPWGHWASQTHGYSSRGMHDTLGHYSSMMTSNRLAPHYSSLLMQPGSVGSTTRLGPTLPGHTDISKAHTETPWTSRYHSTGDHLMSPKHLDPTAALKRLDGTVGDSSKDLYWF